MAEAVVAAGAGEEASAAEAGGLRFVSYNVRRFTDPDGRSTAGGIAAALRALTPTPAFVCLNEVDLAKQPGALEVVAAALGGGFAISFFGHVTDGTTGAERYGNALLSRWPPSSAVAKVPLPGGTTARAGTTRAHRMHRGLLVAEFERGGAGGGGGGGGAGPAAGLTVACTHLDHIAEAERVVQLRHVVATLAAPHRATTTVLLGDLNALTRSDYSSVQWSAHAAHNQARGWSPPAAGCLGLLEAAGFVDGFLAAGGGGGGNGLPLAGGTTAGAHAPNRRRVGPGGPGGGGGGGRRRARPGARASAAGARRGVCAHGGGALGSFPARR